MANLGLLGHKANCKLIQKLKKIENRKQLRILQCSTVFALPQSCNTSRRSKIPLVGYILHCCTLNTKTDVLLPTLVSWLTPLLVWSMVAGLYHWTCWPVQPPKNIKAGCQVAFQKGNCSIGQDEITQQPMTHPEFHSCAQEYTIC